MGIALLFHLVSAVIWIGGMFFAWLCLRPAAGMLDASVRVRLWTRTLELFFPWVLAAVIVLLASGFYLMHGLPSSGSAYVHAMLATGIVMMLLFLHVYFSPFRKLRRSVAAGEIAEAGRALRQIRILVGVNLILGLIVLIAAAGSQIAY